MTRILFVVLSLSLANILASCGGSSSGDPPPPPPNPIVFTVKVNSNPVTPFAGNVVGMASGDTISVTSDVAVTWAPQVTGALVTNLASSGTTWTARIAKPSTAAASYQLVATAGASSNTLQINVPEGDTRNGNYKLFATDANEYQLMINFDTRQYTLRTAAGAGVATSTFTGPSFGTYDFSLPDSISVPGGNTNFRVENGLIVGAFPVSGSNTPSRPFVAANHFVTSAADLPLTNMWMFSSDNTPAETLATNGRIQAIRLLANQITYCSMAAGPITTVGNCLPADLSTYTLTFNPDVGSVTWLDNGVPVNLYVVRAGTELILVRAQSYPTTTNNKRFQIALDDAKAVATGTYDSHVSNGSHGTTTLSATTFARSATAQPSGPDNVTGALGAVASAGPLRNVTGTTDGVNYFVQSTGVLAADIAGRSSTKAGQIAFGLKR